MQDAIPFYDSVQAGIRSDLNPEQDAPATGPVFPPVVLPDGMPSGSPVEPEAADQPPRKWQHRAIVTGIFVVFIHLAAIGFWFGSSLRAETLDTINQTLSKLSIIKEHGHDVRNYYARLRNNSDAIRSPISALIPFTVQSVHAEVREVDSEVTAQFGQVLAEQRKLVSGKLESFSLQLEAAERYPYSSKDAVTAEVARMRSSLVSGELDPSQLLSYSDRLDELKAVVTKELGSEHDRAFGELENKYSIAVNFDYPSREIIETYISSHGGKTTRTGPTLEEVLSGLEAVQKYTRTIEQEVEEEKRKLIFTNIANLTKEVDSLLAFFATRSGYTTEISLLNRYKNNVAAFTPAQFSAVSAAEMQRRAESELFSLVEQPRKSKRIAEEKERQELIALQKRLQEEKNIPLPPLDVPKLIYVDLAKQRLYAYENGISIFQEPVPVTTGKRGFETVTGQYAIYVKYSPFRMRSPFPGIHYDNMVDYFMPFYQGYGFHDASWRSVYGTPDYLDVGSHGCINTPYSYIKQLYYWADIGTTVLIR
ncbi:MAG: L,D-transpeptidase [Patescibacteria group bacterium]|nr:L,D-transpeptidase [Patescibacteria group bacterium]